MEQWPAAVLSAVARTALVQLAAAGVIAWLMRRCWQDQPKTCRAACLLVLLQGWLLIPLTIAIPWYDPVPEATALPAARSTPADDQLPALSDAAWFPGSREGPQATGDDLTEKTAWTAAWRTRFSAWAGAATWTATSAWLAGIVCLAMGMILRHRKFVRTLSTCAVPRDAWRAEWARLLEQYRVGREIRLWVTRCEGPMLCRLRQGPTVLVPGDLWQALSASARRLILRHELAHYLRGDLWKSLLVRVLALPQWFHPGAWWAVRMFDQCGERLCDELAASGPAERIDYARALAQLAAWRLPVHAVGSCAHSHPLVSRVRFLLTSPKKENGIMRSALLLSVAAVLFVAGAVRVQLVAKDVTYTKESAKAKIDELDQAVEKLTAQAKEIKQNAKTLKEQVDAKIAKAKELYQAGNFSDAMRQQMTALDSGDEAKQLAAIGEAKSLGDEGLILLALAAGQSSHEAVRRKALQSALDLGVDGAPVFAYAFETLPDADRIFLAELLAKDPTPECFVGLAAIVEHSAPPVQEAVIGLVAKCKDRVILFAVIGQAVKNDSAAVAKLIATAAKLEGDDGLVLLYAVAKRGDANQRIAAVQAAAKRGQEALPVLAGAFKSNDPEVRTAVVRAAKAVGGDLAEQGIQEALQDPDAALREAAEKALKEVPAEK